MDCPSVFMLYFTVRIRSVLRTGPLGLILVAFILGTGCDWTVGPGDEGSISTDTLQTHILEVHSQPHPIPPGDTATFTAVIADSTDSSFEFRWYLAGVGPVVVTDTNEVKWPSLDDESGIVQHVVVADNGADSLTAPTREFTVTVEETRRSSENGN